ncbi:MAG: hypothetical protein FIB06_12320 [Betaproteobacteria bacterium]|nr:hypothetical protein [Betaproteobacteria bacterium]
MPRPWSLLLALFALLVGNPVLASGGDPPGRVGRLALVEGGVSLRVDRRDEGGPAAVNWPIVSGALLDTNGSGRAEVWIGSSAFRMAADSRLEFVAVDDRRLAIFVAAGTLSLSLRDRDQAGDLEVSTPDGRVRFPGPGRFRIEVGTDRTTVAAQSGEVRIEAGQTLVLRPGEMAEIARGAVMGVGQAAYGDAFDNWVSARDERHGAGVARRHVSPYMTGYSELDVYGDWASSGEYGTVWYPRAVASDWAPYRHGRWVWMAPWGWTWVDAAPWGFAPFHYGRWVVIRGRWAWVPGAWVARPVYAPALVGWVGDPGWSVSFAFGTAPAVGWFPLAPREIYVPAYRASTTYLRQVNVTHVTDSREIDRASGPGYRPAYVHRERAGSVTVVPAAHLREGRSIDRGAVVRPGSREMGLAPRAAKGPDWMAPPGQAAGERYREWPSGRPQPPTTAAPVVEGRQAGRPLPSGRSLDAAPLGREVPGRSTADPERSTLGGGWPGRPDERSGNSPAGRELFQSSPMPDQRQERQRSQPAGRDPFRESLGPAIPQQQPFERRPEAQRDSQPPPREMPGGRELPMPGMQRPPQPSIAPPGDPFRGAPREGGGGRSERRERDGWPPRP